jgi:hypothetical protein
MSLPPHRIGLISPSTLYVPSGLIILPDRPLGIQKAEACKISRQSTHKGDKAVSPTHRISATRYPWYSFLLEAESIPGT